ncbi:Structural maintenance of chromosomes protein [Penicillium cataractarum]|uniref:Structural maintenance of chromosomes protein n=1 Tax=Penicillium cataractarum TaxID=2100454 RepID=A0A9W9SFE8_9EURO|nr:Structural maintenance of chromosomes protein [Penicillium cataractarum]KAJ5377646.1 Structural maintenance of chromosomes protein [Penicillium cataractarum]
MSSIAKGRPSRRAAARRSYVVEETSESEDPGNVTPTVSMQDDDDDDDDESEEEQDYTPVPNKSKRASGKRLTLEPVTPATVKPAQKSRRSRASIAPESEESDASQAEETDENDENDGEGLSIASVVADPDSPSNQAALKRKSIEPAEADPASPLNKAALKRQSMTQPLKSRGSIPPKSTKGSLPTPEPSASPEPTPARAHRESVPPLSDITESAVNNPSPSKQPEEPKSQISIINPNSTILEKPMDIVMKSRNMAIPAAAEEPAEAKPRMIIQNLILTNFKSYAGRQVVGPFHASFSSVVGPNGSGKSNVIDSLLFVFGFRASKMRQGKISALIHNSAQYPDLSFCEVEVHFEQVLDLPEGSHEVIPDSHLVISRRAFKNNSSKYYMNKKETSFTAVTTFLKDRGIDLDHKRFLILQGEVESIAQMKAKAANEHDEGLLEYLEDIIGTSKYKTPIDEAATELESLNDVCVEKNNRVQHVEKEKTALVDKKDKALAYLRDENELAEKQSALYQIYINECADNVRVTEEAILQMQELLNMELEKHEGNESGIKELEKAYKRGVREYEGMEKESQALVKEMAKYDKENVKFEEKRKFLLGKHKKLEKTMQTSRLAASECQSLVEKFSDDIEKKTNETAQLEKEMKAEEEELDSIRESLKGKTQGLSEQIAVKQKSLEPWNEKINQKQSAMAVAQSELDILHERSNAGAVLLEEAQAKIATIEETIQTKENDLEERQAQKETLEAELAKLQSDLKKYAAREPEVRAHVSSARQKADEARVSLASTQNRGSVLTGLMRLKESGRIDGFHGRLGNLGTIDEKYDVAISTACPALDNMVVETVEVGQQCIDYLRKNNLGRANFILLDRLPRRDMSTIYTPESVPRLFDLVKPKDPKFAPAFYSVMQNTLVAKDLEQANRIAYGARRWRVVTLDGQLIDVSGTMSGGGNRVARGGMSSKQVADTTKEQVGRLEADLEELERKFQIFQEKQRNVEANMREKTEEIPRVDTKIQKIMIEIDSAKRSLADAQRRVKELQVAHKPSKSDEAQVAALEKQIEAMSNEIDELNSEKSGIEEEIQELQSKIMEVGGVRLRGQKAKVDGLKEQINMLNDEISNAEVQKSKNEKLIAKHSQARDNSEKEIGQITDDLEKLEEDVENQASDASGWRQKADEAQEALETKKDELKSLKAELDEKVAELNETRATEIEMRNKLEENQKALGENQKRSRYWEEKLSRLSLQNISDLGEEQESTELQTYTKDELDAMNKESLKAVIAALEEKVQNASVDLSVIEEYRRRAAEHESRSADLAEALSSRDAAKARLDGLRSARLNGFMEGFGIISLRLKEMYQMITMGGNAELELVDSLDPFSEGILFSVMPPKKSWKNIGNLSGGEKTLSSLALVFALHHYKPTPLYVMDEIDAALDFRNVSIVASYIKERTKNAQFIVISLRNNMFELASRLVGVYKVNHMTKSVTIENRDYIEGR